MSADALSLRIVKWGKEMTYRQIKNQPFLGRQSRQKVLATVLVSACLISPTIALAQESMAMVEPGSMRGVATVGAGVSATSVTQDLQSETSVPVAIESTKSTVTGLEPGTLALIGFGLLALAATRRNAR
ncbi:MAG: hypothetical protein AB8B86_08970 [Pseudomonadales bacterium]